MDVTMTLTLTSLDTGHHVRIWSVPLVEELRGKRMGDAFEKYAAEEALVIGMYRKAAGPSFFTTRFRSTLRLD